MADSFLDRNADVKSAIAERKEEEKQQGLSVATVLQTRLERIITDAARRDTFVNQLTVMREQNEKLAKCTPASLLSCMIACGHLDLMPNTAQQYAFIIPYGTTAQFQLGYKGLMELAYRSGQVRSINAELVFPADTFKVTLGTKRELVHEPSFDINRTEFEKATKVYATAVLTDGSSVFEVMSMDEVNKIKSKSQAAKSSDSPWKNWPETMAKKTVIKRLLKFLPSSTTDNRFKQALDYDDWAEAGKLRADDSGNVFAADEPDFAEAADKPKDRGIKSYANHTVVEGEVVDTSNSADVAADLANEEPVYNGVDDTPNDTTENMSDDELQDAITEMLDFLKLDDMQLSKVHELLGSSDVALADRVGLVKAFVKLDSMVGRIADSKRKN